MVPTSAVDGAVARPRGLLRDMVLLMVAEGHCHGYDVAQTLADWRIDNVGSLYRLLRKLEAPGLVHSEWEFSAQGRVRRVYSLTPSGDKAVTECVASLERLDGTLDRFSTRYEALGRLGLGVARGGGHP